jgi:hypothetical protein
MYGQTAIHPVALALTLAMAALAMAGRRDQVVVAFLVVACFITHAQRVVVVGLDFSMLRIIVVVGLLRILARGEAKHYRHQRLDTVLLVWLGCGLLASVVGPRGSSATFIYNLGVTLDAAGTYFLFRVVLRDIGDVERAIRAFSWIALAMIGPMIIENLTGRNPFSIIGGVKELSVVRGGRLRCQGSFSHSIMSGTFGASTFALVMALRLGFPRRRFVTTASLVAATGVMVLSSSSGPLISFMTGVLGWGLWPFRQHMRTFVWSSTAAIVAIHFIREKPVWHLIGRVSQLIGGEGWHRYKLIDQFVMRFREWWFFGTRSTSHWNMQIPDDATNQYVLEGIRGGLPKLLSFVVLLFVAFRTVGRTLRQAGAARSLRPDDRRRAALLAWGLGTCLATHAMGFMSISYFGQLQTILFLHIAMIPSLSDALWRVERAGRKRPASAPAAPTRSPRVAGRPGRRLAPTAARRGS